LVEARGALASAQDQPDAGATRAWHGHWTALSDLEGIRHRVELRIEPGHATLSLPELGLIAVPLVDLTVEDGRLSATASLLGRLVLTPRDQYLEGVLERADGPVPLTFSKDGPEVRPFTIARLGPRGRRVEAPAPAAPAQLGDGWAVGSLADAGIDASPVRDLLAAVCTERYPAVDAVVLVVAGRLVLDEYFHGKGPDDLHTFQSCTKSVTALLFGAVVDRGLVDLDEPVWRYVADRRGHRWVDQRYDVTVRQVLAMSVGLRWEEQVAYTDPTNDNTRMNASGDWLGYVLDRGLRPGFPRLEPGLRVPGRFEYQSGLTILLGAVVRSVTGRDVDDLTRDWIFAPLGIERFVWLRSRDGTVHTGGGLFLRPRDAAKLGQLVLRRGEWDGHEVVSSQWIDAMTSVQSRDDVTDYGFQWFLPRLVAGDHEVPAAAMGGYGGQFVHVVPALDVVAVSNATDYLGDGSYRRILEEHLLPAVVAGRRGRRTGAQEGA